MNREDLQLFMTIFEEQNLLRAAELLYLSPSTAGSRLRAMEEELGFELFERKKGVKAAIATPKGVEFSRIAAQMLTLWNEADLLGRAADAPFLSIATVDSFLDYNLTPLYRDLISRRGFSLDIKCYPADMIYSLVSRKQADVGFALYHVNTPHVNVRPVMEDPMVLVVPQGSRLVPENGLVPESSSFCDSSFSDSSFSDSWDSAPPAPRPVSPYGLPPEKELFTGSHFNGNIGWGPEFRLWHDRYFGGSRPLVTATSISILSGFLETEDYWTIMPYTTARGLKEQYPIRILPLDPAPPKRTVYMLTHQTPSRLSEENTRIFTGYLKEYLRGLCRPLISTDS